MPPGLMIALAVVLLLALWLGVTYNGLIRLRNHCRESWAGIDTELKRRYDLIPNLVEVVRGYAQHERNLLESVVSARTAALSSNGTPASQARDENALARQLRQLIAVAESYPDLKAGRHYLQLQTELSLAEERLARARRFYNSNVRDLNTRIEIFPSSLVAGWFSFMPAEYFEIDEVIQRQPVAVNLGG